MKKTKKNVSQFNDDIGKFGSYSYTTNKLSSNVANSRISNEIASIYDFSDKVILDIGCGDGSYTLEFPKLGVRKVIGVDPAIEAIELAKEKAYEYNMDSVVEFKEGNIYDVDNIISGQSFDCIVIRGVLHHLPDAQKAIQSLSSFDGDIIILEPNGNNGILKIIEKLSSYHRKHEERSFSSNILEKWINKSGFHVVDSYFFNIVPFFCPEFAVKILKKVEPFIERFNVLRWLFCGQVIFLIKK